MRKEISDKEIIGMIETGGKAADKALIFLVDKHRINIMRHLRQKRFENVDDLFQEGLIAVFTQIQNKHFRAQSSIKTYLISICTKIAYSQFRRAISRDKIMNQISDDQKMTDTPEQILISEEKRSNLDKLLSLLGDNCKQILSLWALQYSMEEIASLTEYKNANSVKKKKFGCFKKLMKLIEENPNLLN